MKYVTKADLVRAEEAADRYDGLGIATRSYRPHVADLRLRVLGPNFNGVVQPVPGRFSTQPVERPREPVAEEIEQQAWDCSRWPDWLAVIVDRTNEVADRLDMSSEQAHAYAALSAIATPPSPVERAELVPCNPPKEQNL